jgi:transcription-repair coupling factor (superfamily II helicase)
MQSLLLSKNEYPLFSELKNALIDLGYTRVPMVIEPGEFAIRGSICDVFSVNHVYPVRVEYFDDDIERICSFNFQSQRSISTIEDAEIFHVKQSKKGLRSAPMDETDHVKLLSDFSVDDYIVHEDYGVGQFKGLLHKKFSDFEGEYLLIEYASSDKLFLPLDQIQRITRYSGADTIPKLNGLHDGSWQKKTAKIRKQLIALSEDLYRLHLKRQTEKGFACKEDTPEQLQFEGLFPYGETPDQISAIEAIKTDMEAAQPMDRLLCGDVGFGKTEVVMRAAFKAVDNHKQVVILAPTTLLAYQHFLSFKDRFKDFPITVDMMSRFRTTAQNNATLKAIKQQHVDIVVGTHRLLQTDVEFKDLGLIVVDEEHRFGVKHKENLKKSNPLVDVLSVSATPIPRTLYMALTGAKDISAIRTPPKNRKPILTHVLNYDDAAIKDVIETEIDRNGQVFYLFNNVQRIDQKAAQLKQLLPGVSTIIAHGQMPEKELKAALDEFRTGRAHVLLCSTIIENGLDLPRVNTLVVEHAERFGLSQIHQIRGRVGRSGTQAFAYLFSEHQDRDGAASKRLQAIREFTALGSGYQLALKDLEIRGAGTLLGYQQSGNLTAVGFDLYCKILEETLSLTRYGRPLETPDYLLSSKDRIYIPETYIPDERERLAIYQRLYSAKYDYDMNDILEEMADRYGAVPAFLKELLLSVAFIS